MANKTDNKSSKSKTLSEQVKKAMNKYFKALGDVKPANVYEMVMAEVEPELLIAVMQYTNHNLSKAAAILGLNRATLRKKITSISNYGKIMNLIKPKTALISLSDKTNLEELISFLLSQNVKMISTGGTYQTIKKITDEVIEVSDFTGFEEMMDGRVKTLHPKIHAGILARRDQDIGVLEERGYEVIDLVIVNLYPFKETIASDCSFEDAIEKIDIGGPTMIRSAAKNFKDVAVITNPQDYSVLMSEWSEQGGISYEFRKQLSQKVFALMADYNLAISEYLADETTGLPNYSLKNLAL